MLYLHLSLSLSFTPEKPNSSVKCFWREEALLNRGSFASKTWPPFFLALLVPSVLPRATLICYLPKQMLGTVPPTTTTTLILLPADVLPSLYAPLHFFQEAPAERQLRPAPPRLLPAAERPASAWQRTRHREVKGSDGAVQLHTLGLPPQRALQHLGGVGVVVLGQDEDHLQDTKIQRQCLKPK